MILKMSCIYLEMEILFIIEWEENLQWRQYKLIHVIKFISKIAEIYQKLFRNEIEKIIESLIFQIYGEMFRFLNVTKHNVTGP